MLAAGRQHRDEHEDIQTRRIDELVSADVGTDTELTALTARVSTAEGTIVEHTNALAGKQSTITTAARLPQSHIQGGSTYANLGVELAAVGDAIDLKQDAITNGSLAQVKLATTGFLTTATTTAQNVANNALSKAVANESDVAAAAASATSANSAASAAQTTADGAATAAAGANSTATLAAAMANSASTAAGAAQTTADGAATAAGTAQTTADGAATAATAAQTTATSALTLANSTAATVSSHSTSIGTLNDITTDLFRPSPGGGLTVAGQATVDGPFTLTGAASLQSSATVSGNATLSGAQTLVGGRLTVQTDRPRVLLRDTATTEAAHITYSDAKLRLQAATMVHNIELHELPPHAAHTSPGGDGVMNINEIQLWRLAPDGTLTNVAQAGTGVTATLVQGHADRYFNVLAGVSSPGAAGPTYNAQAVQSVNNGVPFKPHPSGGNYGFQFTTVPIGQTSWNGNTYPTAAQYPIIRITLAAAYPLSELLSTVIFNRYDTAQGRLGRDLVILRGGSGQIVSQVLLPDYNSVASGQPQYSRVDYRPASTFVQHTTALTSEATTKIIATTAANETQITAAHSTDRAGVVIDYLNNTLVSGELSVGSVASSVVIKADGGDEAKAVDLFRSTTATLRLGDATAIELASAGSQTTAKGPLRADESLVVAGNTTLGSATATNTINGSTTLGGGTVQVGVAAGTDTVNIAGAVSINSATVTNMYITGETTLVNDADLEIVFDWANRQPKFRLSSSSPSNNVWWDSFARLTKSTNTTATRCDDNYLSKTTYYYLNGTTTADSTFQMTQYGSRLEMVLQQEGTAAYASYRLDFVMGNTTIVQARVEKWTP